MTARTTLTIHPFDPANHRPGLVSQDQHWCAWGNRCQNPATYSIDADEPAGRSWWACCDQHARGLAALEDAHRSGSPLSPGIADLSRLPRPCYTGPIRPISPRRAQVWQSSIRPTPTTTSRGHAAPSPKRPRASSSGLVGSRSSVQPDAGAFGGNLEWVPATEIRRG